MARKQTRRCVSLNKGAFQAGKLEADRRGITFSGLVEFAFREIGVVFDDHPHQTPDLVRDSRARRTKSIAVREAAQKAARLPSRERQLLGDCTANACGFA